MTPPPMTTTRAWLGVLPALPGRGCSALVLPPFERTSRRSLVRWSVPEGSFHRRLAEAVADAQTEDARLVGRLSQVVVAGVGVDDRVLVGEIRAVELSQPMAVLGIHTEAQVEQRIGRLQHPGEAVRAL